MNAYIGENIATKTEALDALFNTLERFLKSEGVSDALLDKAYFEIATPRRRAVQDLRRLAKQLEKARIVAPNT
jgi:hypothetical protein